jgi:hypothetical protein
VCEVGVHTLVSEVSAGLHLRTDTRKVALAMFTLEIARVLVRNLDRDAELLDR